MPVALITGASRGIGRAIAETLAATGHDVVLHGRDEAALAAAAAACATTGRQVATLAADLRDAEAAAGLFARATEALGTAPGVVVNNAGSAPTARFDRTTDAQLDEVLDLHLRAPFALIRTALPAMRAAGAGCIVQLASTAGLRAFPYTAAYTAAKHAMVGMTRALATELGDGPVRTYAVCPGFVDTRITRDAAAAVAARGGKDVADILAGMAAQNRIGRLLQPAEVADAVAWLVRETPAGVVLDLDREPRAFVAD